jgi:hypothetical protein
VSVDLMVYMRRAALPSAREWSLAVKESGFALAMEHDFDPATFRGFLPCLYQGAPTGFEYHSGEVTDDEREVFEVPPELDFVITLATRSDGSQLACATIALGVLCRLTNGMLYDPQSGEAVRPDEATEWVNEMLKELAN